MLCLLNFLTNFHTVIVVTIHMMEYGLVDLINWFLMATITNVNGYWCTASFAANAHCLAYTHNTVTDCT